MKPNYTVEDLWPSVNLFYFSISNSYFQIIQPPPSPRATKEQLNGWGSLAIYLSVRTNEIAYRWRAVRGVGGGRGGAQRHYSSRFHLKFFVNQSCNLVTIRTRRCFFCSTSDQNDPPPPRNWTQIYQKWVLAKLGRKVLCRTLLIEKLLCRIFLIWNWVFFFLWNSNGSFLHSFKFLFSHLSS